MLDRNADHIAAMTHCTVPKPGSPGPGPACQTVPWQRSPIEISSGLVRHNGARRRRFAREVQKNLGLEPMREPFLDKTMVMTPPWEAEEAFRKELPAWQMNYAADDYVDYSWHAPTVRLYVAHPSWRSRGRPSLSFMGAPCHGAECMACIDPMWTRQEVIANSHRAHDRSGRSRCGAQRIRGAHRRVASADRNGSSRCCRPTSQRRSAIAGPNMSRRRAVANGLCLELARDLMIIGIALGDEGHDRHRVIPVDGEAADAGIADVVVFQSFRASSSMPAGT